MITTLGSLQRFTNKLKHGLFITLGLWAGASLAQENAIEKVTANQSGSAVTLTIQMKAPLRDAPANFSVTNPARIAVDFPGTVNALGKSLVEVTQGDLRSVNVVQAGDRSRVVLNLLKAVPYSVTNSGNTVVVTLNSGPAVTFAPPAAAAASTTAASAAPAATAARAGSRDLRSIDFRRGNEGEGRVVVDLPDSQTPVDIRQQGQTVVVDFLRTSLPENLRRQFDTSDFGTPVQRFRVFNNGENVRMVIEPRGLWEHSAYQSDTQLVVDVRAIKEDPNKLIQGSRQGYKGERLSLNFQNVDVRSLLQVIADFTNLNIITSETVQGNITLRLKDVPWDQALDIILQTKGLDMRKNGNVILVAPKDELATKEKLELEQKSQIADLEPIRSEVFQLSYQKAEDVKKLLGDSSGGASSGGGTSTRILSKRGSAAADPRTNQLFVQDTPSKLDEIRRFIARLDIAVRQVMIEARIVEAEDRFGRNLGVKLGFNDRRATQFREIPDPLRPDQFIRVPIYGAGTNISGGSYGSISGNLNGVADVSTQTSTTGVVGLGNGTGLANTNFVNLPSAGISGSSASPASIAFSLFGSSLTRFLNLELSALEADRKGKIVASPRVVTADQAKAIIEQGTEFPYLQATSSGATSVSFRKAVLKLEVTPQITPEGGIILDLLVNKDARGELTAAGPAIDTKNVQTRVLVDNGGTVVIGGIYTIEERNQVAKVPLLGDLPYIGALFRNTERIADKTELLIFITPKVISERLSAER
jgi:type IV pilus assembly protein PilQ